MSAPVSLHLFADYKPHAKQIEMHRSKARYVGICAGRRSGKTYSSGREFIKRVLADYLAWRAEGGTWEQPEILDKETKGSLEYWCVAPTYVLGAYQRQEVFEAIGGTRSPLILAYQRGEGRLWLVGGIKIEFKSASDPNKLVGSGLSGIWCDEAARLKSGTWGENLRGTLSDRLGWALFSSTPMGRNWYYDDIWSRTALGDGERDEAYAGFHFSTADNTAVPHLVAEAEQAKRDLPLALYMRNYEADWDAFEGKIFADFLNDDTHIFDDSTAPGADRVKRVISGMDWGFNSPGSIVEVAVDAMGDYWVMHEEYAAEVTVTAEPGIDSWVQRALERQKRWGAKYERIWADPSEPGDIKTLKRQRLPIKAANNSVTEGIDAVARLLHPVGEARRPRLRIHRNCKNLRRELSGYKWDGTKEKPHKVNDHAVDGLRYAILNDMLKHDPALRGTPRQSTRYAVR